MEAYPDLKLQIEGYTDSTGSVEHNQELSERRAATVRDFLIGQGVNINNVSAQGFGPANPVASNDTREGRQMNRRVDLVVSGESIQAQELEPAADQSTAPASMAAPTSSAAPAANSVPATNNTAAPVNNTAPAIGNTNNTAPVTGNTNNTAPAATSSSPVQGPGVDSSGQPVQGPGVDSTGQPVQR